MRPELILDVARSAGRQLTGPQPNGEYLVQCPFPEAHRNGDAHPSCRLNPEKGVWRCDPCGRGGGMTDLAVALGVPVPRDAGQRPPKQRTSLRRGVLHFVAEEPISVELRAEI